MNLNWLLKKWSKLKGVSIQTIPSLSISHMSKEKKSKNFKRSLRKQICLVKTELINKRWKLIGYKSRNLIPLDFMQIINLSN